MKVNPKDIIRRSEILSDHELLIEAVEKKAIRNVTALLWNYEDRNGKGSIRFEEVIAASADKEITTLLVGCKRASSPRDSINSFNVHEGGELLVEAAEENAINNVKSHLRNGTDVDFRASDGTTSLGKASYSGHTDVVKLLLQCGATVDVLNGVEYTPLMFAALGGHTDISGLLIQNGADVKSDRGAEAFRLATQFNNHDVAELLIQKGADIEAKGLFGRTALINAAMYGDAKAVTWLLDRGAQIEAEDKEGKTALIHVTKLIHDLEHTANDVVFCQSLGKGEYSYKTERYQGVLEALIERGADANHKDRSGWSAIKYAETGHMPTLQSAMKPTLDILQASLKFGRYETARAGGSSGKRHVKA